MGNVVVPLSSRTPLKREKLHNRLYKATSMPSLHKKGNPNMSRYFSEHSVILECNQPTLPLAKYIVMLCSLFHNTVAIYIIITILFVGGKTNGVKNGFLKTEDEPDGDVYPDGPLPPADLRHRHHTTRHTRVRFL